MCPNRSLCSDLSEEGKWGCAKHRRIPKGEGDWKGYVPSLQKLLKTRDLQLPLFEGSLVGRILRERSVPSCTVHPRGQILAVAAASGRALLTHHYETTFPSPCSEKAAISITMLTVTDRADSLESNRFKIYLRAFLFVASKKLLVRVSLVQWHVHSILFPLLFLSRLAYFISLH